jgi:antitoxin component YwqK of YwqJK toxin-antitoxin module
MLVVFFMLHGFGQDDNDFSWDDFTYNSPEEKAFWDNVPVWSDVDVALFIDDIQDPFWVFDSDGSLADENSTDLYTGYAKSMQMGGFLEEDRYGNSIYNQRRRNIGYFKDGILSKIALFNENGKKIYEHSLLGDGLLEEKDWYYNGQIAYLLTIKQSSRDYINAKSWLPNGDKCKETNLRNGTGRFCSYYENGQRLFEENYKNEIIVSRMKWYENGQNRSESNYKDGKLDGLSTWWYSNGKKEEERNYKDGDKDGLSTKWYENGQKKLGGNYKVGKKEGLWTWWYENGQKKEEAFYENGQQDGRSIFWHENGQKSSEGNYKDGRQDGLWTSWQEDGNLTRKTKYKDKTRTVTHYWVSTGKKKEEGTYKNNRRDGLLTMWFENGQKELEENYKDGKRLGVYKKWDENGTLIRTGRYNGRPPPKIVPAVRK